MKLYRITEEQITELTLHLGALVDAGGINKAKLIASACLVLDGVKEIEEEEKEEETDGTEH